jgi:5'-3' exonuclease
MADNNLHTFSINFYSEVDDRRYQGTFTVRKLTIRDMTQLGVRRTQLCGGLHYSPSTPGQGLDIDTYTINSMVAQLEISLVKYPDWWNIDQLTDLAILSDIYKEVVSFENNFPGSGQRDKAAEHRGSSQDSSEKTQDRTDHDRVVEQMVVGQVSASLEP